MKITAEDYTTLAEAITPHDTEEVREAYRTGNFVRADQVKDLNMRYRWDLYWYAVRKRNNAILSGEYDVEPKPLPDSTNGYNMSHIDTALRKIVAPL